MARKRINPKAKVDLVRIYEVMEKENHKTSDNPSAFNHDMKCSLLCYRCNYNCDLKYFFESLSETASSESEPFDYERAVLDGWKPDDPW